MPFCLCNLQFLLPVCFLSTCLLPSTWDLFQGIFFFFDVVANEIILLISISDSLFLMYRNATDLLILNTRALLNSLMNSRSFGWCLWDFLNIVWCHVQKNSSINTSSFLICILFVSFSFLIAGARTFKTTWQRIAS